MDQIFKTKPYQIYEYLATKLGTERLDDTQNATRQEWDLEDGRATLIRKEGELVRGGRRGAVSAGALGTA